MVSNFVSKVETTIWTFSLNVPFATWAALYDSEDVTKMHEAVGIKSLSWC